MAVAAAAATTESNDVARLRPPSRLRLVDDVAHSLEDAILAGEMRPGERLIETRICAELGVSRTTLREALLMLERRGLVRSEPRRGTFVTRLSRNESRDLRLARALLEAYAVSAGYERLDEATFAQLDDLLDRMAACALPEPARDRSRLPLTPSPSSARTRRSPLQPGMRLPRAGSRPCADLCRRQALRALRRR